MTNMQAVRLATDIIKEEFGTLEKIPEDLTITIVNLYYKLTVKLLQIMGIERKILIPESVKGQIRQFGSMVGRLLSEEPQIVKELESVIEKVRAFRGGGKDNNVELEDPTVGMILDSLKKDNGNAQAKAGIQKPR